MPVADLYHVDIPNVIIGGTPTVTSETITFEDNSLTSFTVPDATISFYTEVTFFTEFHSGIQFVDDLANFFIDIITESVNFFGNIVIDVMETAIVILQDTFVFATDFIIDSIYSVIGPIYDSVYNISELIFSTGRETLHDLALKVGRGIKDLLLIDERIFDVFLSIFSDILLDENGDPRIKIGWVIPT